MPIEYSNLGASLRPHLVSSREAVEKPSSFDRACQLLKDVVRREPHATFLWMNGRWSPAKVDDIMRAANTRLKQMGKEQFAHKPDWIVQ